MPPEDAEEREEPQVRPQQAELIYHVGYALHPDDLVRLADRWGELLNSGMPGTKIRSISYEPSAYQLKVMFT